MRLTLALVLLAASTSNAQAQAVGAYATSTTAYVARSWDMEETSARALVVESYLRADQPGLAHRACEESAVEGRALDVVCGVAALRVGDRDRARLLWIRASQSASIAGLTDLALLTLEHREVELALTTTARLIELAPTYDTWRLRAAALRLNDRLRQADEALASAILLAPERPEAFYERGVLAMASGDDVRANALFNEFVARVSRPTGALARAMDAVIGDHEGCAVARDRSLHVRVRRRRRGVCRGGFLDRTMPRTMLRSIEEMVRMAAEMERLDAEEAARRAPQ